MDPNSYLSQEDQNEETSLWDSPVKSGQGNLRPTYEQQEAREQELRHELESVRRVNEAIEGVIESLGKAKNNIKTVNTTVSAASTLLNTWTRILSQTEHNQRLILDPNWHGASQDIANIEQEASEKQRAAERREAEEQERRSTAAQRAEEEEKRKAELAIKQSRPTSSRGSSRIGTTGRGSTSSTSTSYVQMGGSTNSTTGSKRGTTSTRRANPGIGRGRGSRGRG
ncbi:uncharacterized protein A1O9_02471 [Exophiala aquamarina CBS 119918]|uniref:DASH complex subunit DUO1 n=1 Tax=Exophiala aquamarina CBS 119918 TaxID=1182545 RepID=A0A072PMD4_9EURO|nr:uncharacterized protein A1O9_02471 [Exophiala aquamarina CBS 119918]KEF60907.1 hypothetical protein A1O9_02471 [Exophiala aquamarina CBS 119918]